MIFKLKIKKKIRFQTTNQKKILKNIDDVDQ